MQIYGFRLVFAVQAEDLCTWSTLSSLASSKKNNLAISQPRKPPCAWHDVRNQMSQEAKSSYACFNAKMFLSYGFS